MGTVVPMNVFSLTRFVFISGLVLLAASSGETAPFPQSALTKSETWHDPAFKSEFRPQATGSQISHRRWPETTSIFNSAPHMIAAKFEDDEIVSINLLFLDSGTHFGYIPRSQAKENEKANRGAFQKRFREIKDSVVDGLEKLGTPEGRPLVIGQERMLKQVVGIYRTGDLVARLHTIDEQLIKVTFFKDLESAAHWMPPEILEMRRRERSAVYVKRVNKLSNGDVILRDVPLLPQGDRAYCGVSALSMTMQYLGLAIDTEDFAAASGIRYGSTRGSKIREVYSEAAEEAGFRMSRTTRFDFGKAKKSIDEGIPVLVWRKWTQERDFIHTSFARRFLTDPTASLPEPNAADRATWPGKNTYSHATVITGYNEERREVIFTESWSERERNRRMRIEEMEATAYYTFYLRL